MDPLLARILGLTGAAPAPVNPDVMTVPPQPVPMQPPQPMPPMAGAQPGITPGPMPAPMPAPLAKPPTAMPDRGGAMLPMDPTGTMAAGSMDSYYNDFGSGSPAVGQATLPTDYAGMAKAGLGSLQDIQVGGGQEAHRPLAPPSPPTPWVRPEMDALMQTVLGQARQPEDERRKMMLSAMLGRG